MKNVGGGPKGLSSLITDIHTPDIDKYPYVQSASFSSKIILKIINRYR